MCVAQCQCGCGTVWSILKPPRDIFSFISRHDAAGEGRELSFTWDEPPPAECGHFHLEIKIFQPAESAEILETLINHI